MKPGKITAAGGILLALLPVSACREGRSQNRLTFRGDQPMVEKRDPAGRTIASRFAPPAGYIRPSAPPGSFAAHLRGLPLKPPGSEVRLYDGRTKDAAGIYAAVVDLPIGSRDLHQCADAVIRLRAEYLMETGRPDDIRFHLTNGFEAAYSRWRRGERIAVRGNDARWTGVSLAETDDRDFWTYLETVFTYAGTASLEKELDAAPGDDPEIGDVFIRGGHPGHAVIVVDKAADPESGRTVFLLVQSYMPAQEIQVLVNPGDPRLSPWYASNFGNVLRTPEWTFVSAERKRFRND